MIHWQDYTEPGYMPYLENKKKNSLQLPHSNESASQAKKPGLVSINVLRRTVFHCSNGQKSKPDRKLTVVQIITETFGTVLEMKELKIQVSR